MIRQLVSHIHQTGLDTVGIFRVSATASLVTRLQAEYKASGGSPLETSRIQSPVVAATLLKQYCRSLPDPLIPYDLFDPLVAVMAMSDQERMVQMYRSLIQTLPSLNREVLQLLAVLFEQIVERSDVNKMTGSSLGLVVGPSLLSPGDTDDRQPHQKSSPAIAAIICDIVDHHEELFAEPHEEPVFVLVSKAMFDFKGGDEPHEHPFKKGDIVFLTHAEDDSGWREGTIAGQDSVSGTFPGNYLEVILDIESMHTEMCGTAGGAVGGVPKVADDETLYKIDQLRKDLAKEQQKRGEMERLVRLLSGQYSDLKAKVDSRGTTAGGK